MKTLVLNSLLLQGCWRTYGGCQGTNWIFPELKTQVFPVKMFVVVRIFRNWQCNWVFIQQITAEEQYSHWLYILKSARKIQWDILNISRSHPAQWAAFTEGCFPQQGALHIVLWLVLSSGRQRIVWRRRHKQKQLCGNTRLRSAPTSSFLLNGSCCQVSGRNLQFHCCNTHN